ncbi:MAG: ATP-dependent DNA ligase [Gemmatimonadota bacterium]|nr:MAG: ATP-dependent DNA ligase [Gemmatimonadota bacterium]
MARKRIPDYCGPKRSVAREDLARLDKSGEYVVEEKHDGEWCRATLDANGVITELRTRTNAVIDGVKAMDLVGLRTGIAAPALLVGELVADTRNGRRVGARRLHLFDVLEFNGTDCRDLRVEDRRSFLVCAQAAMGHDDWIKLVEQRETGFVEFYDEIIERGGEGVVIKKRRSKYRPRNADGKIAGWLRCKPFRTVDYIVIGTGKTKGGATNLALGLLGHPWGSQSTVGSRVVWDPMLGPKHVMYASIPRFLADVDPQTLIGTVVEVQGYEVFNSGAVRHGQITRVRDDKPAGDCTLEAARNACPVIRARLARVRGVLDSCSPGR